MRNILDYKSYYENLVDSENDIDRKIRDYLSEDKIYWKIYEFYIDDLRYLPRIKNRVLFALDNLSSKLH